MSGLPILTKTNFTAGELSLDMLGRGDLAAYANGAMRLRNVTIAPVGGVSRRAGLRHVDTARGPGRLIAFEFNTEQTYLLVLTDLRMDVYADGIHVADFATPWTGAQVGQLAWTQTADTLLVVHPEVEPRRITRTSHAAWTVAPWTFFAGTADDEDADVIQQPYHKFAGDDVTLQPSGISGSVTLTASASVFQAGHVGLRLRLKAKEVKVTAFTSATQVTAEVKQTLVDTEATKDWEEQALSPLRGWPVSACFHQDRLVIGGTRDLPNRLFLSKSSDLFNFDLGEGLDDEAIEFALLSDQVNAIRAVFSGRHLQVFTSGAEWMVSGDPLTPSKIQLTRQTRVGSPVDRTVSPRDVDGATLFVSRDGNDLREFLFADVEQAYQSTDLAMLAKHLVKTPVDMDYDSGRRLFHVVMDDGTLGTVTVYRSEKVTAWTQHSTEGRFRSVAVVDSEVYLLVEREGVHTVERFDPALALDAALTGESAEPKVTWDGLDHLEGRSVRILADGGAIENAVVTDGAVTLAEPARTVQVGLPFAHEVAPLPPVVQGAGGPGTVVRLVRANFRLLDTQALHIDTGRGLTPVAFRRFGRAAFDAAPPTFSGDVQIRAIGWRRDAFQPLWRVHQDTPLPCTILAVATEMKITD
ncbi:hypothetical protein [Magnetospirillum sp. UT-4]|uniref:hypothetical protein n=1 Tax=Magnetospirillum sp. UT-4 TaxID=2681467 RepID=UPI001380578D|nr:hypothetical protein [Magnetospirillum sp. UT-4]CAA7617657.1 conserved hypothetical protein [Magnetospirillum sp. UT-4]